MSQRFHCRSGGHMHLEWESQPIIGGARRVRRYTGRALALMFVAGLLLGLLI